MSDDGEWPVDLSGVTESVVTTYGPNDRWNAAALGLLAGSDDNNGNGDDDTGEDDSDSVTARTWGNTRTRQNFHEHGKGYVQFTPDPVDFVEAACSIREEETPILDSSDAWVRVSVEQIDSGEGGGTQWELWRLSPIESTVERRVVPSINRGYYAIIEATVAASRLDVSAYDTAELRERIAYFESVVDRCGGDSERAAWDRFEELVEWR
jgi:hypothetical protein